MLFKSGTKLCGLIPVNNQGTGLHVRAPTVSVSEIFTIILREFFTIGLSLSYFSGY